MPEILTESFCERCGTRYTFETARPKIRLKGVKTLSRGLRNFVLSDDTSMDEAMAAARSEADRETTAHQLDAFHETFNFCMSCRQYTCPNCWNEAETRCQTCAPLALPAVMPTAYPSLSASADVTLARPAANEGIEDAAIVSPPVEAVSAELEIGEAEPENLLARLDALVAAPDADATDAIHEPTIKANGQTADLLRRFRVGQSLDAELAAFERERSGAEANPAEPEPADMETPAAIEADSVVEELVAPILDVPAEPEPVAAAPAELEPVAAAEPEPEPVAPILHVPAEPEPVAAAEPEPEPVAAILEAPTEEVPIEPEPLAAAEAEPEPTAAAPAEPEAAPPAADVVAQPTWRIGGPGIEAPAPANEVDSPTAEPQWPAKPEWPAPQASSGLPFLGRPVQPEGGVESLWAASNRELAAAPPAPGRSAGGIQPCINCGLSLSATARFCRRCGTLQGR